MKVVYVCSPYRGTPEEVKRNFDYAVELTKEVLMAGYYPITPHLYITLVWTIRSRMNVCLEQAQRWHYWKGVML